MNTHRRCMVIAMGWLLVGAVVNLHAAPADPYAVVNTTWDRFGSVYRYIVGNYYTDIDHEKIMQAAIEGMLTRLDSYSQFYDKEGLRQLRQDTSGRFAGLGITVGIKDRYPVVINPIEDTPASRAGLIPGDLIVQVDGRDMYDVPLDEVVELLRGEPGTRIDLKVVHAAVTGTPRDIVIVREIIKLKTVALVEKLESEIGYISMRQTRFSEDTTAEVEQALKTLNLDGVRGVILDLRGNPGGLLGQAIQVADLFLDKGAPIVSVKERHGKKADVRYAQRRPIAVNLPMVVLIDAGSASAAEVVAGAIQDNDRGVVVGMTSFGKGSVQTIFDLYDVDNSALKLTTALYYTPSGRSIHRDGFMGLCGLSFALPVGEKTIPAANILDIILNSSSRSEAAVRLRARFDELEFEDIDRLFSTSLYELVGFALTTEASESSLPESHETPFFTQQGRKVYGGGGITPDIHVPEEESPDYVQNLEKRHLFFDFVVEYVGADTIGIQHQSEEILEQQMIAAFQVFLETDEVHADRIQAIRYEVNRTRSLLENMGWDEPVYGILDSLAAAIEQTAKGGFTPRLEPYIRRGLKRELALRLAGRRAQLLVDMEKDLQLQTAIEVLLDETRYNQVLQKGSS
jgi:carboxyl-terminal processing protease